MINYIKQIILNLITSSKQAENNTASSVAGYDFWSQIIDQEHNIVFINLVMSITPEILQEKFGISSSLATMLVSVVGTKIYITFIFDFKKHLLIDRVYFSFQEIRDYDSYLLLKESFSIINIFTQILYTIKLQFNEISTFVIKSKYVARLWDLFYICPLAPESVCFFFALYNVVKAGLLYYYYTQSTYKIDNSILLRGISLCMSKTLLSQINVILFFFINPVIFDRVMVMCNGLIMSHGFISLFKIGCIFLFRAILLYIVNIFGILRFIFAIETFCLITFMILFSLLLFTSNNLIFTLMLFECLFFCLIPLMATGYVQQQKIWDNDYELLTTKNSYKTLLTHYNNIKNNTTTYSSLSVYGTMQYFLYNAFFLGFYIFAISFLFFYTRSFSYFELYSLLLQGSFYGYSKFLAFVFFCIISMICFKMGIVPYHGWMLAVFANLNIVPLMLLLLPFKLAIFSAGLRLFFGLLHPYLFFLQPFLFLMAFISMVFGAFGMFVQLDIRKFLLYSTINHSGYILIGMCSGTIIGLKATLLYIIIYIISTLGFLVFIGSTINRKTHKPLTNFLELASVSNLTVFPFIIFFIILLSMAGIPPFAGFWAKFYILETLYSFGLLGWVGIIVIILTSTLTVVGYLRIIKFFFIDHTITTTIVLKIYNLYCLRVLLFVGFFLLFFFVFNSLFYYIYGNSFFYKVYCFFRLVL